MRVKIVKLSDDAFNGEHPNGINKGFEQVGQTNNKPTIGERFQVGWSFSTSPVIEIINDKTFKTTYSTYSIEYLDDK